MKGRPRIPEYKREGIKLCFFFGFTIAETCRLLGLNASTVCRYFKSFR